MERRPYGNNGNTRHSYEIMWNANLMQQGNFIDFISILSSCMNWHSTLFHEEDARSNNPQTRHSCLLSLPQDPAASRCPEPQDPAASRCPKPQDPAASRCPNPQFSPFTPSLFIKIHFNNLNPMHKPCKWFPSFWFYNQNFGRIFFCPSPPVIIFFCPSRPVTILFSPSRSVIIFFCPSSPVIMLVISGEDYKLWSSVLQHHSTAELHLSGRWLSGSAWSLVHRVNLSRILQN